MEVLYGPGAMAYSGVPVCTICAHCAAVSFHRRRRRVDEEFLLTLHPITDIGLWNAHEGLVEGAGSSGPRANEGTSLSVSRKASEGESQLAGTAGRIKAIHAHSPACCLSKKTVETHERRRSNKLAK